MALFWSSCHLCTCLHNVYKQKRFFSSENILIPGRPTCLWSIFYWTVPINTCQHNCKILASSMDVDSFEDLDKTSENYLGKNIKQKYIWGTLYFPTLLRLYKNTEDTQHMSSRMTNVCLRFWLANMDCREKWTKINA